MTLIGPGTGTAALNGNDRGSNGVSIDDYCAVKMYNSVLDSFKQALLRCYNDGKGTGLEFANNTLGRFGGGTPGNNRSYYSTASVATDCDGVFFNSSGVAINNNSDAGVDPKFRALFRDNNSELTLVDPRPSAASPLWTANGGTLKAGAPVETTYRGAFGSTDWTAGWTKLSETCAQVALPDALVIDTDGDGLSDNLETTSAVTTLGCSASVNNVTPTNLFSSLYTASTIQDLRGTGMMIGPVTGATATVTLPLFKSTGLNTWTAAGNVTGTVDTTPGKQFFRVDLSTNAPNP
jgi:hypothetical protein